MSIKRAILVVGGAGYVGSHVARSLYEHGFDVIILDAFVHHQIFSAPWARIIQGSYGDAGLLDEIFSQYKIDAVMHLAGYIEVGESVTHPDRFYNNNVVNSFVLLDAMRRHGVASIIFSSSCAVYGNPQYIPMDEEHPQHPMSPYGRTKLAVEWAIQDYARAYHLNYVILRYFNAAGASPDACLGEQHHPETHLIPLVLHALMQGLPFTIYGDDYRTHDGTCIRDYIHVQDIADAHLKAYSYIDAHGGNQIFNLGTGIGISVKELVAVAQEVTGLSLVPVVAAKRAGDVPILVADHRKAERILHWNPTLSDLKTIISSAYQWERMRLSMGISEEVNGAFRSQSCSAV